MLKESLGMTQGEIVKLLGLEVPYKSTNINISTCPFKNGLKMSKVVDVIWPKSQWYRFVQALCQTILSLNESSRSMKQSFGSFHEILL